MLIKQFTLGPTETNTYVLGTDGHDGCVVIDVGPQPSALLDFLSSRGLSVAAVVVTHGHYDHIAGIKELLKAHPQARLILGQDAQKVAASPLRNLSLLFFRSFSIRKADRLVAQPQGLELAGLHLEVLDLPGHSPGSIGLYDARD